jgi:hypothetical protein
VFERIRADWRKGRALKYIKLGEPFNYTWKSKTAGEIVARVRFDAEGETLVMTVREIGSVAHQSTERVDWGLREIRDMLEWVAGMAADLGYTRMRLTGPRAKRAQGHQTFEFDLERFRRGSGAAG